MVIVVIIFAWARRKGTKCDQWLFLWDTWEVLLGTFREKVLHLLVVTAGNNSVDDITESGSCLVTLEGGACAMIPLSEFDVAVLTSIAKRIRSSGFKRVRREYRRVMYGALKASFEIVFT